MNVRTRKFGNGRSCVVFSTWYEGDVQSFRQELSLQTATSNKEPWTPEQDEVLRTNLTTLQAARELNRTAYAIRSRRRLLKKAGLS